MYSVMFYGTYKHIMTSPDHITDTETGTEE